MAVTQNLLTSGSNETDQTSYDTASISPAADQLILLAVMAGPASSTPSVSGNGLTWVAITNVRFDSDFYRLVLFRAMGGSPSSGVVTIDYGGTQDQCIWAVSEFDGVDTGGTNGSAAIVQFATNSSASATSLEVILAAFADAANATYGTFGTDQNGNITSGAGFAELSDEGVAAKHQTEWRDDNDISVNASFASSPAGGIAVEIKAASIAREARFSAFELEAPTAPPAAPTDAAAVTGSSEGDIDVSFTDNTEP